MALSRITIAALLAAGPAAAQAADPVTAEQALANYRAMFKPIDPSSCPKGEDGEIVICAERERERPQFAPTPGVRPGRVAGELPRGAVGGLGCLQSCHQPAQINLLAVPGAIKKGIARILGKD